jgi:hypothetical protein
MITVDVKTSKGVLARAENKPIEPDPGNAGVGRKNRKSLSYAHYPPRQNSVSA